MEFKLLSESHNAFNISDGLRDTVPSFWICVQKTSFYALMAVFVHSVPCAVDLYGRPFYEQDKADLQLQ